MCFSQTRQRCGRCVYCEVKKRNYITTLHQRVAQSYFIVFKHTSSLEVLHLLSPVCTCPLYILSCLSPHQVSLLAPRWFSVMECVLVVSFSFPPLSLPLSMGTLGLRQSCVAMAAGCVAELRTPGIWSLSPQSPSLLFIPPFSQVSFGAAEAISTTLSLSLSLTYSVSAQSITPRSRLTYVMRHIYLKTKFMSIPVPVPLSLPSIFPPPRFTFSVVVCTSFPSPFPCGGSNTALWDTTVP